MQTYAFIDASNLFYGGKKSLGWSIDYQKLHDYLKDKYNVSQIFYFGGVEIHNFPFDYLTSETVSLMDLEKYLIEYIEKNKANLTTAKLTILDRHMKQVHFYQRIETFGYNLILKPVKIYEDEDGNQRRKANCDVDMAFYLLRNRNAFDRALILSGDGDFLPVLKYLKENKKEVLVLARANRTAKEIKKFAGSKFLEFEYLRERLKRTDL